MENEILLGADRFGFLDPGIEEAPTLAPRPGEHVGTPRAEDTGADVLDAA